MADQALYSALDSYNKQVAHTNVYDRNWGSVFDFIDIDDTGLLTQYSTRRKNMPKPRLDVSDLRFISNRYSHPSKQFWWTKK